MGRAKRRPNANRGEWRVINREWQESIRHSPERALGLPPAFAGVDPTYASRDTCRGGTRSRQGMACSSAVASWRTRCSAAGRLAICTPIGTPLECMASGSDIAGVPMMLWGTVYWIGSWNRLPTASDTCRPRLYLPQGSATRAVVGDSQMSYLA